jgi:flagellin FlaB
MFRFRNLHRDESGQTALEAAIILIAFIVVASVFAFAVLSAGSESTERGQEAIYAGLEDVQSSLSVKGAVIAQDTTSSQTVDTVVFTVAKVSGGEPVDMTDTSGNNTIVIGYRDEAQFVNEIDWAVNWIGDNDGDALLEEGELAEVSVDLSALTTPLAGNTQFTIEIKPPTGAVFQLKRTTPAAIEAVMELR